MLLNKQVEAPFEKAAQFLLVNSECINENGLIGKISFVYFLFTYGRTYSNEHYEDFAFEILKDLLAEEIPILKTHKGEDNSKVAGIGWGLIKLIEDNFFESDDFEDILELMDSAVLLDIDTQLKNNFNTKKLNDLIVNGNYLVERKRLLKNDSLTSLKLNSAIHKILSFLSLNLDWIIDDDYLNHILYLELIKNSSKKFTRLQKHIEKHQRKLSKKDIFSSLIYSEAYEMGLIFNEMYFGELDDYMVNKIALLNIIENKINPQIENLLSNKGSHGQLISKLIIQTLFLIKKDKFKNQKLFLLGLFNNV